MLCLPETALAFDLAFTRAENPVVDAIVTEEGEFSLTRRIHLPIRKNRTGYQVNAAVRRAAQCARHHQANRPPTPAPARVAARFTTSLFIHENPRTRRVT